MTNNMTKRLAESFEWGVQPGENGPKIPNREAGLAGAR